MHSPTTTFGGTVTFQSWQDFSLFEWILNDTGGLEAIVAALVLLLSGGR